jgi:two-component system phosphate regulon sensor histidine kinase PhoR
MKLAQRLLLGALLIVSVFLLVAVVLSGQRLRTQLVQLTTAQLAREARLVAQQWLPRGDNDALANAAGASLGHRVTLIDSSGVVLGDSEFDGPALTALQNHANRPEIIAALRDGEGSAQRISPSEGDEELYVAVRAGNRIARVSIGTAELDEIVARARRDVLLSGVIALVIALALAAVFSRQVTAPIAELRDVAGAIAAGDLSQRPALSAPGEVGELASAVRRMAEQLDGRLQALQSEDVLLSAIIESLNEGVVAVDAQRRVVRINSTGRTWLDLKAEVPFSADLLPRDRELLDALQTALGGDTVDRVEVQVANRILAVTARPLGLGGAVLAFYDLTGIRRLETVRRDFVANVSHELKTPLTAIRGFAETLVSELTDRAQHSQFADTIRSNAERMHRLVDDLLDLSKIESGGWTPSPSRVDVAAAANDAINPYRSAAQSRGVTLRVEAAESSVTADPVALRQVLTNLVENAVRYTSQGGEVVVFSKADAPTGGVWIGVRDSGAGISAEHLPRIFERFYRIDPSRARAEGGTGLGLAIVRHLVEAHGGRAVAESELGSGTTIGLLFPPKVTGS